tara:strand:+ start:100 stop:453 length:354 start_codon:yes stop_codon:yes gene_type:complete
MSRETAFEEFKKQVKKFQGQVGNVYNIIEKYQKDVEKFPTPHIINDKVAQLEALAGSLLHDTQEADKLLNEIETKLDHKSEAKRLVRQLCTVLGDSLKILAGVEVIEEEINTLLHKK